MGHRGFLLNHSENLRGGSHKIHRGTCFGCLNECYAPVIVIQTTQYNFYDIKYAMSHIHKYSMADTYIVNVSRSLEGDLTVGSSDVWDLLQLLQC